MSESQRRQIPDPLTDLEEIRKELAERSLVRFTREAWRIVEPGPYIHGWHIDAIAEHLEATVNGQIKRLIINIPPRHMKSLIVAVFFPAWTFAKKPSTKFMYGSYEQKLATRDSVRTREIILSPWYQRRWGDRVQLKDDQNLKTRFETTANGLRLSMGVGGGATGEGGDFLIADDPHNVKQSFSDAMRQIAIDWWDLTMSSRLNNLETGVKIVIMQRLHERDLTGHIRAKESGYDHLVLPAEFEPKVMIQSSIGFSDPRTEDGAILWPERFRREDLEAMKKSDLGSYGYAGQYQQRPAPLGGGMIKLAWFKRYRTPPARFLRIVQSWDTANVKKAGAAYWCCTTWGETDADESYLLHVFRRQMDYPEGKRMVRSLAELHNPDAILVENKSSGLSLIPDLQADHLSTPGVRLLPLIPIEPEGDKVTRMSVETAAMEAGLIALPEFAEWLPDYEGEMGNFPNAAFLDQADSTSQYLNWKKKNRLLLPGVIGGSLHGR